MAGRLPLLRMVYVTSCMILLCLSLPNEAISVCSRCEQRSILCRDRGMHAAATKA